MAATRTDGEAIAASVRDPAAFVPVFDRHFGAIRRYLARRLGSDLGGELAAETFTRAFDARGRYDTSRADALPWLYGIAANLVRRHLRAEERRLHAYAQ
ncbi:MAG: RNA polymerase sigma factor [Gaiellaceae bacterium]